MSKHTIVGSASLALLGIVSFLGVASLAEFPDRLPQQTLAASAAAQAPGNTLPVSDPFAGLAVSAKGAYVFDIDSNEVMYEKNGEAQLPLASITKVALVLAVSDALAEDDPVTISRGAVQRGEGGGLGTGEIWRAQDLIDFTLIASSNAGAEALAETADAAIGARYPEAPAGRAALFRMNAIVHDLGLSTVYFLNPSGLDESETQPGAVGSARDIAHLIAYAARQYPTRFAGTSRAQATLAPTNAPPKTVRNTNEALADIPGLILGKTGYTDLAGGNLAVVFKAGERRIAAVVLGSSYEGRFEDIRALARAAAAQTVRVQ